MRTWDGSAPSRSSSELTAGKERMKADLDTGLQQQASFQPFYCTELTWIVKLRKHSEAKMWVAYTQEAEAGRSGIQGQLWLQSEFAFSLSCMRPCLKKLETKTSIESEGWICIHCRSQAFFVLVYLCNFPKNRIILSLAFLYFLHFIFIIIIHFFFNHQSLITVVFWRGSPKGNLSCTYTFLITNFPLQ